MKRKNSRAAYFVQRIPGDIKAKIVGHRLAIPFGDGVKFVTPSARAQSISFSLRTNDPAEVKILQANIAAHLETVWTALREDASIKLSHRQATALAGDLYRVWADGEGLTIKTSKPRKLRAKGFSDKEAVLILKHAKNYKAGGEAAKLAAVKRWVPWLCAFTGARVGEMLQLRKQDVRREGKHWVIRITPEAGPVKTDEARDVVLHEQIVESGFMDFVKASGAGHLFISPSDDELGVRKAVKTARNKVNTFVREVVPDSNVNPSHGWRHRFKTVGIDEGVEMRVLDAIQGHAPRNISEGYGEVTIKAKANAIAKFLAVNLGVDGRHTQG